jgi:hypothetical protein
MGKTERFVRSICGLAHIEWREYCLDSANSMVIERRPCKGAEKNFFFMSQQALYCAATELSP